MNLYDLESVKAPVLTRASLRFFAWLLERRLFRGPILEKLLDDAGMLKLRRLRLDTTPTFYPIRPAEKPAEQVDFVDVATSVIESERRNPVPSIRDYFHAYREGRSTPTEVAEHYLRAVEISDQGKHPLRAMIACDRQDVLRQAREASRRIEAGQAISPLDGIPVAIKDELDMVPYPTTVGTAFLGDKPAAADATLVARLRAQGALLLGKTNMHEIGINPNGHNMHYGMARNPWDPGHDPGGSSSGSAVSVASGLCPIAIGADGGGSIRIPAAFCGIIGLKGTWGRFSEHGVAPLCPSVGHVGPLGATVEDVVLAYLATAGPDPRDEHSLRQGPGSVDGWDRGDLEGVRIGVFRPWFDHAVDDMVAACRALLDRFVDAGARVVEVEIAGLDSMRIAHAVTILAEMANCMGSYPGHHRSLSPTVRVNLAVASAFTAEDYLRAQKVRSKAMAVFDTVFESVDLVVTPATATTATPIREAAVAGGWSDIATTMEAMRFVVPGNLAGLPAISFPAGYDASGLPIGMQAMARHWDEQLLLRLANVAEQLVDRRLPSTYFDLLQGCGDA